MRPARRPSLMLLFMLLTRPAQAQRPTDATSSDRRLQNARLTHVAFSRDGLRIAAAWFTPARDRGGTNWQTGIGVWDLESGDAGILPDATGPVAISPDGRQVLAARYRLAQDDNGQFVLRETGSNDPVYRLLPGQPVEKL